MQDALAVSLLADGEQWVCDLGSYNGYTIAAIGTHPGNHEQVRFVGIDNSCDMLDKSGQKLTESGLGDRVELIQDNLDRNITQPPYNTVLMNWTLPCSSCDPSTRKH